MRKDPTRPDRKVSPKIPAILLTTALAIGGAACSGEGSNSSSSAPNNQPVAPVSGSEASGSDNASSTPTTQEQQPTTQEPLTVTNETVTAIPNLLSLVGATINVPVEQLQTTTLPGSMINVQIASEYNEDPGTDNTVSIAVTPIPNPNPFPGWLSKAQSGNDPNLFRLADEVNGNQAVWASNNNLATEFGGYLLDVQVTNQGADGNELPSNMGNAAQIATVFENNATS